MTEFFIQYFYGLFDLLKKVLRLNGRSMPLSGEYQMK